MKRNRLLIFILIMCFLPVFSISAETEELNEKYEQSLDMLISMNIMEGYTTEDWNKTVTRAEFAKMLCNIVFDGQESWGSGTEFTDISEEHGYYSAVYALNDMNIMVGYNNQFEPEKNIKYEEAVTSLVSLLGYSLYADESKGYPNNYLNIANSIKLDKNLLDKSSHDLNLAETAMLIYNALHTDMVVLDINSDGYTFKTSDGITPLIKYMNVYKDEGLFEANSLSGIFGEPLSEGNISIDGEIYGGEDNNDLLGCLVDFYYKDSDVKNVVYMRKNKKVQMSEIDAQKILSFEDNIYYFESEDSGKVEKLKLAEAVKVIYNGRVPQIIHDKELFMPTNGKIILIDNNDDSRYDTVFVWSYETYVVKNIELSEGITITDYYDKIFELRSYEDYTLKVYKDGVQTDLSGVTKWNVLSIAKSEDVGGNVLVTIHISDKRVSGRASYNSNYVTIDGEEYPLSSAFDMERTGGVLYDFWLDVFGYVVCYDPYSSDLKTVFYGYVTDMYWTDYSDEPPILHIFTENGEFMDYKLAKSIRLDGQKYKDSSLITQRDNALWGELTGEICQMIGYKLNKNGEITYIDTLEMGEGENRKDNLTATRVYERLELNFLSLGRTFGDQFALSKNTKVFQIPFDSEGNALTSIGYEEDYKVVNGLPFTDHYDTYTVQFYNVTDAGSCKLILQHINLGGTSNLTKQEGLFSVKSISRTIDDNDEEVIMLNGYFRDGTFKSYEVGKYAVEDAKKLNRGDIIYLFADLKNKVQSMMVIWYANEENDYYLSTTLPYNAYRFAYGKISAVDYDESVFRVCYVRNAKDPLAPENSFTNNIYGWDWYPTRYDTHVMIYNSKDKSITPATSAYLRVGQEIVMYKDETSAVSVVVIE